MSGSAVVVVRVVIGGVGDGCQTVVVGRVVTGADSLTDLAVLDLDVDLNPPGARSEVDLDLEAHGLLDFDLPTRGGGGGHEAEAPTFHGDDDQPRAVGIDGADLGSRSGGARPTSRGAGAVVERGAGGAGRGASSVCGPSAVRVVRVFGFVAVARHSIAAGCELEKRRRRTGSGDGNEGRGCSEEASSSSPSGAAGGVGVCHVEAPFMGRMGMSSPSPFGS